LTDLIKQVIDLLVLGGGIGIIAFMLKDYAKRNDETHRKTQRELELQRKVDSELSSKITTSSRRLDEASTRMEKKSLEFQRQIHTDVAEIHKMVITIGGVADRVTSKADTHIKTLDWVESKIGQLAKNYDGLRSEVIELKGDKRFVKTTKSGS